MIEIAKADIIAAITGIILFWILVYSPEKEKFDATDEKCKIISWCKNWGIKHNDNVLAHFFLSAPF